MQIAAITDRHNRKPFLIVAGNSTFCVGLRPVKWQYLHRNIDLRLNVSYRQILKIALPISAALLVPQVNFITNNIFFQDWVSRNWAPQVLQGYFT